MSIVTKQRLCLFSLCLLAFCGSISAQNVGIGTTSPVENLHVDSTIKVGKNQAFASGSPRKNLIKFGDGNYVTIGEEQNDDRMYLRYGDLILQKSSASLGSGYIGVNTDAPNATLDINGSFRLRGNGAAAGKVLVSDANGVATWQTTDLTLPYLGVTSNTTGDKFAVFNQSGTNSAGYFENTNAGSYSPALEGKYAKGVGIGVRGEAQSSNSASPMAIQGFLGGNGTNGYAVYGTANNATAIAGATSAGIGVSGTATSAGGIGGVFHGNPGAKALQTSGSIQLKNIGEGVGKVLTSDANGNATWQAPSGTATVASLNSAATIPSNTLYHALSLSSTCGACFDDLDVMNGSAFYIAKTGVYEINVNVAWLINNFPGSAKFEISVGQITSTYKEYLRVKNNYTYNASNPEQNQNLHGVVKLTAGEYVSISVRQESGINQMIGSASSATRFSIKLLY